MPSVSYVLYDRDCGFCRWALSKVLAADRRRRLRPRPIQDPRNDELFISMSEEERLGSWHLLTGDGELRSAGAALGPLFRLLPGGGLPARAAEALPRAAERAYRLVAGNRSRLGRFVTDGAKRRADARIADRAVEPPARSG